jgi:hypothetical protein
MHEWRDRKAALFLFRLVMGAIQSEGQISEKMSHLDIVQI